MKECGKPGSKSVPELEILIERLGGAIETAETLGVDEKPVPWVLKFRMFSVSSEPHTSSAGGSIRPRVEMV